MRERLLTNAAGTRVDAVEVVRARRARTHRDAAVIVSCGAVNSAALLLRSANDRHPHGLANSSGLVGRRYMAHLATMMQGVDFWRKNADDFQKTLAINDFYLRGPDTPFPLGQIQSQGRTHAVMAKASATRGFTRASSCGTFRSGRTRRGCRAPPTGWR